MDQNAESEKVGIGRKGFIEMPAKLASLPMNGQKIAFEIEIDARLQKVAQRDDITIVGMELF